MPRYFLEVAYKGTNYSGFQIQQNAITIQSEVEKALQILFKKKFELTGSSRTDAGVHALQNFFHFDSDVIIEKDKSYNLNAILTDDIVLKNILPVTSDAHCRFDADFREYKYNIYTHKNPFLKDRAYYFPYKINVDLLHEAAAYLLQQNNFASFSKKHTQVNNFICQLSKSQWYYEGDCLVYNVAGNRFLRGMVRALVATMLKVAQHQITIQQLEEIVASCDCNNVYFDAPACGLFLCKVSYPPSIFI